MCPCMMSILQSFPCTMNILHSFFCLPMSCLSTLAGEYTCLHCKTCMGPSSKKKNRYKGNNYHKHLLDQHRGRRHQSPSAKLYHSSRLCKSTSGQHGQKLQSQQDTTSPALGTISPYAHQPHLKSSSGCGSRCAHRLITYHIVKQYSRALSPILIKTILRSINQQKVVSKKEGCPVVSS